MVDELVHAIVGQVCRYNDDSSGKEDGNDWE
jgi:hypothetical protein